MPAGDAFRRFIGDVQRVWPGPGRKGLQLLQVGVTVPLTDERHFPLTR